MMLLSHPTGNQNVRQAALALAERGLLAELWTCVSWNPESKWHRLLPGRITSELQRRSMPAELRKYVHTSPFREAARLLCQKLNWQGPLRHETGFASIDRVCLALDRRVATRLRQEPRLGAVYAYEDCARETFRAAAERGMNRIYELPIGYWRAGRAIFQEEKEREPGWAATLSGAQDSAEKLARKDEELQMAEVVIAASTFTRNTLNLSPAEDRIVHVIPYGAPAAAPGLPARNPAGKLKVLFVGGLSQRKGLSYLLTAVDGMRAAADLTLIGMKTTPYCKPLDAALRDHRWIPTLPHPALLEEMSRHDVFVFPSLFEGFGLVILEAMSRGLPVITTAHTAGPDIITEGEDGFLVPIRSAEAIAARLEELAGDREKLHQMQAAAQATAKRFSWASYREKLFATVAGATTASPRLSHLLK